MENNNLILNRFFTQSTFNDLINGKINNSYEVIIKRYLSDYEGKSNLELIQSVYKIIKKEYRNEYFYKNTLFTKLLLGRHSLNTTTALSEVPINKSKADFVLINGSAVVYEIKTELDTFERLESQLNDYSKAFNMIYVITSEKNYKKLNDILINSSVGICVLTDKNSISIRKKAKEDSRNLDHISMFKVLRKKEYENIIIDFFGEIPITTQVKYYNECLEKFKQIEVNKAYKYMVAELKKRKEVVVEEYKKVVPNELNFLIYFSKYKREEYNKLEMFLKREFGG